MSARFGLLLFLLLASAMVESAPDAGDLRGRRACSGTIGDCIDPEAEGMMSSEASRRTLAQRGRFLSYDALNKNRVPCNRRGQSYYNCGAGGRANPYRRGCSVITHCARFTS